MRVLRILGIVAAVFLVFLVMGLGGMVLFGKGKSPAVATELGNQFRGVDYSDLPALEYYRARDGVDLAYRTYLARPSDARPQSVAVLIHGASDSSAGMHAVA